MYIFSVATHERNKRWKLRSVQCSIQIERSRTAITRNNFSDVSISQHHFGVLLKNSCILILENYRQLRIASAASSFFSHDSKLSLTTYKKNKLNRVSHRLIGAGRRVIPLETWNCLVTHARLTFSVSFNQRTLTLDSDIRRQTIIP